MGTSTHILIGCQICFSRQLFLAQHVTSQFTLLTSLQTWKDSKLSPHFLSKQGVLHEAKDIFVDQSFPVSLALITEQ